MMFDAVYARQSVDKADSISVESQIEYCRYEARGNEYKTYIDKGYSGKNTNRPAFEEMIRDIRNGMISRVIVYKLDRISRSILDFANMMEIFDEHNVEFVSSTERFDTSTPIGRAMLNICIVFAQLERETIQKRVSDAYCSRSKRGIYMGGRIPYGFSKAETVIDGIRTSKFVPVPEEAEQIRLMYSLYANGRHSLGDIVSYFNGHGIRELRGGMWSTGKISSLLRNPVYVMADAKVYDFFISQGADVIDPVSGFTGDNACYMYSGAKSGAKKQTGLAGKEIVLAPHKGLVPSYDWLKCRVRCLNNRQRAQTCKAKTSWLAGKVKCGKCGYGLTIVKSNTKWHRYFVCAASLATKKCRCSGTGTTVYADVLEEYMSNAIRGKLAGFEALTCRKDNKPDPKVNELRLRLAETEKGISDLLANAAGANTALMELINERAEQLSARRSQLREEISSLTGGGSTEETDRITCHTDAWDNISFEDKKAVADVLVEVIRIADGKTDIVWNI